MRRIILPVSLTAMALLIALGAHFSRPVSAGQGKGGEVITKPSAKKTPAPTNRAKPPATRPAVSNLDGTVWAVDGREGNRVLGKVVFEFMAGGKILANGDSDPNASWKQTGRRVVITFEDGRSKSMMDGVVSGNQINGTISATDREGASHSGNWHGVRADAALLDELSFWKSIKDSTDAESFKDYLQKYPNGAFTEPAQDKIRILSESTKPTAAAAPETSTAKTTDSVAAPKPGTVVRGQAGIEMVWIPAGSFLMGSNDYPSEQPVHRVTFIVNEDESALARLELQKDETDFQTARRELNRAKALFESNVASQTEYDAASARYTEAKMKLDSLRTITGEYGFYMGKFEVTQAQWQAVMGSNPSSFKDCSSCPVDGVSWLNAQEFLDKLNDMNDGFRYRLPTEAEWEYACRAGGTTAFAFGDSLSSQQANFDGRNSYRGAAAGPYRAKTTPAGSFQPNAWGLYDMHGNVWEWCADVWHENYAGAPSNGWAWTSGGNTGRRVLRGGGWSTPQTAIDQRSANRISLTPQTHYSDDGFRVVAIPRTR